MNEKQQSTEQFCVQMMNATSLLADCVLESLEEALDSTDLIISCSAATLMSWLVKANLPMTPSTYHRLRATTLSRMSNTDSRIVGKACEDLLLELSDCSARTIGEVVRDAR